MRGILADNNNEAHVEAIVKLFQQKPWREFWESLNLSLVTFPDLGLTPEAPDALLWPACQQQEIILITNNRNARGAESLEVTIRAQNTPSCLPIFTLANPDRVLLEPSYAARVAERLLEYLIDIDNVRGTGRLYLP